MYVQRKDKTNYISNRSTHEISVSCKKVRLWALHCGEIYRFDIRLPQTVKTLKIPNSNEAHDKAKTCSFQYPCQIRLRPK